MILRPARSDDLPFLSAIERSSFSDPWSVRSFERLLAAPHARLTVSQDVAGTIEGFCVLLLAADEAEIANLAVATTSRGRGVGRALLDDAIRAADAAGADAVFLEVRPSNAPALSLYATAGFVGVGRRRRYYDAPVEDALILRLDLRS